MIRLLYGMVFLIGITSWSAAAQEKPHILILLADDLGWNDVSLHGSDIRTPHIDQLLTEGVRLDRFYVTPICTPTRAGLLTGKYPDRFGLREGVCSPVTTNGLPPAETTLAEMLGENGYPNRGAFGKWHLGHADVKYHPLQNGFTYFYGHYNGAIDYFTHKRDAELDWHQNYDVSYDQGYSTDLIEQEVISFISDQQDQGPFLAYVAFNAPHSPMQAKLEDLRYYGYDPNAPREEFPVGGSRSGEREMDVYGQLGRGNQLRQTYAAMVRALDRSVGRIVDHLKDEGIYERTLIWFISDNGGVEYFGGSNLPLRGQKHTEWEGGVRVVSAVSYPRQFSARKVEEVTAYIDIFPTIASVVGAEKSYDTDGTDISRALAGDTLDARYVWLGNGALVSDQWKLVQDSLYAIEGDPYEQENVAEQYPEKHRELMQLKKTFSHIKEGQYTRQPEGWKPPENWQIPGSAKMQR